MSTHTSDAVFAQWMDGRYYSGTTKSTSEEKIKVVFDDGAERLVRLKNSFNYLNYIF